jgi:acetylornithine/succinyldiaminopimelate/putrescine aminotransferase
VSAPVIPDTATPTFSARKQRAWDLCDKHWIPGRGRRFDEWGVPFVMGEREGYLMRDLDGHQVVDAHLNGGTFNLGHRNPELLAALREGLEYLDMGNHHFPSEERGLFAQTLLDAAPGKYSNAVMVNSGSEAIDLAVRTARVATGKRKILSLNVGYHGYGSLLPAQLGTGQSARYFLSDAPSEDAETIVWNDLDDAEAKLSKGDVAGLLIEAFPSSSGFLMPDPGYLEGLAALAQKYGVPYIADEVQNGMLRSGQLWACECFGISPDILVTAKAPGGGLLPLGAIVMKKHLSGWLYDKPWAFTSTASGSELACHVGRKVFEITTRQSTVDNVHKLEKLFTDGFAAIRAREPFFSGVRAHGIIFGLEMDHPQGGTFLMRRLYEAGVWGIVSSLDESVIQFKPGLLLDEGTAYQMLDALETAIVKAKDDSRSGSLATMY